MTFLMSLSVLVYISLDESRLISGFGFRINLRLCKCIIRKKLTALEALFVFAGKETLVKNNIQQGAGN